MLRPIIYGLLLTVSLVKAQNGPGKAGYCARLASFGPQDSINTVDLRVETKDLQVRVNANGPELHLQLQPDASWDGSAFQRVGWIRVFSCETGALIQSLEVQSWMSPEHFLRFFEVKDANFDGYLDIAALVEGGGLWGRQTWWVFSPASGKFISNEFTEALSGIGNNGLEFDATRHHIIVRHANCASCGCPPGTNPGDAERYRVENNRLILIHKQESAQIGNHGAFQFCTVTESDLIGGTMRVTSVRRFDINGRPLK